MGFAMEIKNQKNFHFPLFLGKTNDKMFKKLQNTEFSFLLYPYLDKDEFSTKIGLCHFLAPKVP